jgi:CelD/BcsL family acetyltransferase involved in cellulose biosynthesis
MNGRILPIREISPNDELLWRDLAEHAIEPNPLFEADCMIPAAHHLWNGDQMLLVIAEDEGQFFGCFPVIRKAGVDQRIAELPGVRRPVLTTHVRRLRYDGTPLIRAERGIEAATALLSALTDRTHRKDAGILVLEALRDNGPVSEYLRMSAESLKLPMHTYRTYPRPVVQRRDDLTYLSIHGSKTLRANERKRRQLGDKLGGKVQLVDRSADRSGINELLALEAAGYKAKNDGAMELHPGESEWFREMCDRFRETNRLHLYSLQVGETIAAMQLLVRGGDGLFSLVVTYDEDDAKFSPGIQMYIEVINRFHNSTDAQWLDSCTYADNGTFLWLYPERPTVSTLLIPFGGPVDRFYVRLYMALTWFGKSRHRRLNAALHRIVSMRQRLS